MEIYDGTFKPSEGFKQLDFFRYDRDPVSGYLYSVDGVECGIPVADFLEVNDFGLNERVEGLIVLTAYRFRSADDDHDEIEKKYLELSIRELQEKYPAYIIMVPQQLNYKETSAAKDFCVDIDAYWFKPYPYCQFIRWIYPSDLVVEGLSYKLFEIRFKNTVSYIDDVISDLETFGSDNVEPILKYRKYLADTWM